MNKFLNKNHLGDCINIMNQIPREKVNIVVTDPPYNASAKGINLPNNKTGGAYYKVNEDWDKFKNYSSYLDFTRNWLKKADALLNKEGSIFVCCSFHNIGEIMSTLKELNYKPLNIITWKKTNPMPNITKRMLTHSTEFIVWFAKGKGWTFNYEKMKKYNKNKQLRDIWEFPLCQGSERIKGENGKAAHPTQKPLALFTRIIEMSTKEKDIILDPFVGAGTSSLAAKILGRKWIGIDNNKEYISIANNRLKNE